MMYDVLRSMLNYSRHSGCTLNHAPRNSHDCFYRYEEIRIRFFDKESDFARCVNDDEITEELLQELVDIRKKNCNC